MAQCKKDEKGKILLGPSYSPEHGKMGIYNCPYDIAYVHYTFDAFSRAATELNADKELVARCRKYKALLGPYPTAMDKSGTPVVVDWKGCKYKQVTKHNIEVPASPVFPGDQVTWFSPESEKALFLRTIKETQHTGDNSHIIFNIAKTRLSMPEAVSDAKGFFIPRTLPNGFIKMPWKHGAFMQEMIGIVGLVNEFLLQSVQNKIRLFPCWPRDCGDAKFFRLRAQGGFIVSAEFTDGQVVSATIESASGRQLQLLSPWKTIYVNGRKTVIDSDGLVTLNTKPGQVFLFTETHERKPNILFILSDDLSYRDLSCYGQEQFQTPNLDKLAMSSLRFTQAYAGSSECAPSRGSLMTGMHMGHCRIRANKSVRGQDHLLAEDVTVAEVLKGAGYTTGVIGKWGIGLPGTEGTPDKQGFDFSYGYYDQLRAHGFFPHYLMRNGKPEPIPENYGFNMKRVYAHTGDKSGKHDNIYDKSGKLIPDGVTDPTKAKYSENLFQDEALSFIRQNRDKPFFLYYATQLPHGPCITPELGAYKDKPWDQKHKEWAAMVAHMDRSVGKMFTMLQELELLDDTIIFFAGDNGYSQWG